MSNEIIVETGTILESLNNKVDLDGGNYKGSELEGYVHNHCATSILPNCVTTNNITNCLTEIPQRIKLEYENNVSGTLKAGSQVIIPSGFEDDGVTPKFVYKEIEQDITFTLATTSSTSKAGCLWFKNGSIVGNVNRFSGDTAPTFTGSAIWYDTANNTIKNSGDSGATWISGEHSLPIVETNINTEGMQINQVFNGFGYIGSTVWVDKGVKVLAPNSKNTDGTLKNYEINTTQVSIYTRNLSGDVPLWLNKDGTLFLSSGIAYDEKRNVIYSKNADKQISVRCQVAMTNLTNGVVNLFQPKLPFRALDYNDKLEIMSWNIPDYSAEVALAKDNKNITIETKGYVLFKHTSITAGSTGFVNDIEVFRAQAYASAYADTPSLMIPVDIGDTVRATSGMQKFAFYPMKGAK